MTMALRSGSFDVGSFVLGPWGYIGAGILDGIQGISDMVVKKPDESTWIVNRIESFINSEAEYLICEFKEIVGEYFEEYIGQADLKNFNTAMRALQDTWMMGCLSRACLNFTDMDPYNTNRSDCCTLKEANSHDCRHMGRRWKNVECKYEDGTQGDGVCGSNNGCYKCYDYDQEIAETRKNILEVYENSPDLNFGEGLKQYNGTDAILAEAKSATFIIMVYQHLHLLGDDQRPGEAMQEFALNVST